MSDLHELNRPCTPETPDAADEPEGLCTPDADAAGEPVTSPAPDTDASVEAGRLDALDADASVEVIGLGALEADASVEVIVLGDPDADAPVEPAGARAHGSDGLAEPEGARTPDPAAPDPAASDPAASDPAARGGRRPSVRRGGVDPVKALMHRHRELCERAVDPLEIAAGLEAHGVTGRTTARFRHRDVFSLAEEMYARVSRDGERVSPGPVAPVGPGGRTGWAVLPLLPGALCTATVVGLRLTQGRAHLAVAAIGVLAVALGLRAALRRGPLHAPAHHTSSTTRAWTCWLIAYAFLGDGLLTAGLDGGPDGPWPLATAPVLALALVCAPATWCAHLFAAHARRRLTASRGLEEFAASVQPLLLGAFALFLCALCALLALCGALLGEPAAYAGAGTLGALLLLARLLTARGFTHAPAVVLGAAGAAEATALVTVFAGRLPGCSFLTTPVEAMVGVWGAGGIPALVCGTAALTLLIHATRTLTRASAHALPPGPP